MNIPQERRTYPRLRYGWQMYYERPNQTRSDIGRMIDLSEVAARFRVGPSCWFDPGQKLTIRFSHPHVSEEYGFEVRTVSREADVMRVEHGPAGYNDIVVRLGQPLHYAINENCVPG